MRLSQSYAGESLSLDKRLLSEGSRRHEID